MLLVQVWKWVDIMGRLVGRGYWWVMGGGWVGLMGTYALYLARCRRLESCAAASTLTFACAEGAGTGAGEGEEEEGAGGIMLPA